MPRKKLRSKDKITLKMTRKGLVELNKTTGEQRHVGSQERKTDDYSLGHEFSSPKIDAKKARDMPKKRKQQLPPPDFGYEDIRNDASIPANVEFRRDGSMVEPIANLDMDDLESIQLTDSMRQSIDKPVRRSRRVKKAQSRKKQQVQKAQQAQAHQNPDVPAQPAPRPKPIDRLSIPDPDVPPKSEPHQENRAFTEAPKKIETPVDAPIQAGKKQKSGNNFRLDKASPDDKIKPVDSVEGGEKSDAGRLNFSPQVRSERDIPPDISRKKAKAKAMASQRLQFDNAEIKAPEQAKSPDISAEVREERLQYRENIPDPGAEMIKPNEDMQKRRKLRQSQTTAYQQKSAKEAALQEKAASSSSTTASVSAPALTPTQNAESSKKLFFEEDKPSKTENHAGKSKNSQKSAAYQQKFAEFSAKKENTQDSENTRKTADNKSSQASASESPQPKNQKFQFAADEKPPDHLGEKLSDSRRGASDRVDNSRANRLYEKSKRDTERLEGKLGEARDALPQKKKLSHERIFDEQTGKVKREIHLENVAKTQAEHLKGPLPTRPIKAAGNAVSAHAHRNSTSRARRDKRKPEHRWCMTFCGVILTIRRTARDFLRYELDTETGRRS